MSDTSRGIGAGLAALMVTTLFGVTAGPARAQGIGATPLAVDLKKAPVGSWAEYRVALGDSPGKARWSLVKRTAQEVTIEMSMEGGPTAAMGGKMTMRLLMAADPTKSDKPVKQMVMQLEGRDPMEMPPAAGPAPRFERPNPKKLVGKETVEVAAGKFASSHYRDTNERGTLDLWISESVPPLGLIKLKMTPNAGTTMPPVTMELQDRGKDAKPTVTGTPKPFDPAALMGGQPGRPPVGAPPGGAPPRPAEPASPPTK